MLKTQLKSILKAILPMPVLEWIRKCKRIRKSRHNRQRSVQEVFSKIYTEGEWGANYSSGTGSSSPMIVDPYVSAISGYLRSLGSGNITIVDLGCGDFRVGRNFVELCASYQAVDVVPELIERHRLGNFGPHVIFHCLDIIEDELPAGDVCFVRQVFQHLSNAQIQKILPKLSDYSIVFVTEHYPSDHVPAVWNLDKIHGADIRLYSKSGVYLDKPPFSLKAMGIELFLEVSSAPVEDGGDVGVIRTFKIDMRSALNS